MSLLGVLGTRWGMGCLARRESARRPEVHWLLGIGALLPAWVIAFLALVGRDSGPRPEDLMRGAWILSSALGLLGVIATDALLRRLRESGRDYGPSAYWLLGVAALFPAWAIVVFALSLVSAGG